MSGKEINLASECLTFFIKSLPENSYFNVVRFGSEYIPLFEKPVPYTDSNSEKALNLARTLEADLGGTVLSAPLSYVLGTPLSQKNKLRRIFILTDGCVFDPSEVIDLVNRNSSTTMSNAIGIGYGVDTNLVKGIGKAGNGFVDFVLSGDDMRSKVINQLSESLNGLCKIDISFENNESIEIMPPLSSTKFSPGIPATVYFKSANEIQNDPHINIEIEGNPDPTIIQMKSINSNSKSFEYLFNNENIKYLRRLDQTEEVISKITQLSIEFGILCPYTGLIGTQEYVNQKERDRFKSIIEEYQKHKIHLFVKTLTGRFIDIYIHQNSTIADLKLMIQEAEGIPTDQQRLIFTGKQLEEGNSLLDYLISDDSTIHMVLRLRGGGDAIFQYAQRNFVSNKTDDLISIVSEQSTCGKWNDIPSFIKNINQYEITDIIQKVVSWCEEQKFGENQQMILATLISLIYMDKYKKECYQMWSLIFKKGMKWLNSINPQIDWNKLIHSF